MLCLDISNAVNVLMDKLLLEKAVHYVVSSALPSEGILYTGWDTLTPLPFVLM